MGITKTEKFTERQNAISAFAKAFSHPARVAILEFLFKSESCICGAIVDEVGLAQSTISQHMKELKKIDLIKGTVEGTSICYCINKKRWSEMKTLVGDFLGQDIRLQSEGCGTSSSSMMDLDILGGCDNNSSCC